jgi:hypothetical protein
MLTRGPPARSLTGGYADRGSVTARYELALDPATVVGMETHTRYDYLSSLRAPAAYLARGGELEWQELPSRGCRPRPQAASDRQPANR